MSSRLSDPPPDPAALAKLGWTVEELHGSAHDIHHREPAPDGQHHLWWARPRRPALILGSTQPDTLIDTGAAEADGVEVTRRRSGGGVVYLDPATDCWIDVVVPTGSPLWHSDIGQAFNWIGSLWEDVLSGFVTQTRPKAAATGQTTARPFWCFGEVGHGEVVVDGYKVVGLSQRRTRDWVRIQGLALGRWPADLLTHYVAERSEQNDTTTERGNSRRAGRFIDSDPFQVKAGPPPGQLLPDPEYLATSLIDRFD